MEWLKGSNVYPPHTWKAGYDREGSHHVTDGRQDETHFSQPNTNRYNTTLYWQSSRVSNPCVQTFGLNNLILSYR